MLRYDRFASIAVTVFGAVLNSAVAVQVITAWRSPLKWEPESEWEASGDRWQVNGIKVIWALACAHFSLAAAVCMVGFVGILRKKPTLVRFYRDYSIADFSFCTFVTAIGTYAVFQSSSRATVCEELSHHPELLHNLFEMGLNLENCERWIERAGLALVALMYILLLIRLTRHTGIHSRSVSWHNVQNSQRIYLLHPTDEEASCGGDVELIYAPVPVNTITKALRDAATEAWVSNTPPSSADAIFHSATRSESLSHAHTHEQSHPRSHHHHRRHSHSHSRRHSRSSSITQTGTIRLPILPDEGLLPEYHNVAKA
ncbi:hypothetical protein H0H92_000350 [Tricholoma furcatifolium]|nr:hypothetical protein H0H92_000350 [Tricholoma furcatifolium]